MYICLSFSIYICILYLTLYITTSAQIEFILSHWLQKFWRPEIHNLTPPSRNKAHDYVFTCKSITGYAQHHLRSSDLMYSA